MNEETEDGGRCTERSYVIILYLLQDGGRGKFLVVIHKYICSGNPLSVKFAPYSFPPTGIGDGKMEAFLIQIVPETTGYDMSQRIGKVMCYHFGFAGRAGSKIHQ